jgi:hypothetical protein
MFSFRFRVGVLFFVLLLILWKAEYVRDMVSSPLDWLNNRVDVLFNSTSSDLGNITQTLNETILTTSSTTSTTLDTSTSTIPEGSVLCENVYNPTQGTCNIGVCGAGETCMFYEGFLGNPSYCACTEE